MCMKIPLKFLEIISFNASFAACKYQGNDFQVNEEFAPDEKVPCRTCKFDQDCRLNCEFKSCDPLQCPEGQVEVLLQGECCPICQGKGVFLNVA